MNARLLTFVLATFFAIFSLHADAGDKVLKKSQVPQPVLDAFAKARPNARVKEFEKETWDGKIVFAIEFKENGIESEYVFSPDGTLLASGEEIQPSELPQAVAEAISKAHPQARIKEVKRKRLPDGTVSRFEVELKEGRREFELEIEPNGNIRP
jgi:uncharacterized membrane protein YkoI